MAGQQLPSENRLTLWSKLAYLIIIIFFIALVAPTPNLPHAEGMSQTTLYQISSRTVHFSGQGFDSCNVPSLDDMQTWISASPYRAVNLYYGGENRGCDNPQLTSSFVNQLDKQGWKFILTWVGLQASCSNPNRYSRMSQDPSTAYNQGVEEANAAITSAEALGFSSGTIIYYDLENYDTTNSTCRNAAKSFIAGWSGQLQAASYLAGVYGSSCASAMNDFAVISNVPDAVWLANWITKSYDPNATVWNVSCVSNGLWSNHQRIRQYAGDHYETWGGVTLKMDSNVIDGPVAGITLRGDCNGDGKVNIFDANMLMASWNQPNPTCDPNNDGEANIYDVSIMISNWTG